MSRGRSAGFADRVAHAAPRPRARARTLVVVFADQLDRSAPTLRALSPEDCVLMMEVKSESRAPASHAQRTTLFLSALRHLALDLADAGARLRYVTLDDPSNTQSFDSELDRACAALRPARLACLRPGAWRVQHAVLGAARRAGVPCDILEDPHFLTGVEEFAAWRRGRAKPVMEHFYRWQRRRLGVLVGSDGAPEGGAWNYDADNRKAFSKDGPPLTLRDPARFEPDEVTREVMELVRRELPDLPGRLDGFSWPVTPDDARAALDDFVRHRLAGFGPWEDAMWSGRPWLHHAQLAPALNLKLLDPRACVDAALAASRRGHAPLQSVEGFVRQIIGWREFIRGIYWTEGPDYERRNALDHRAPLPSAYWTGDSPLRCVRECVGQVLDHAYGHHIQRLMVTGSLALMAGVRPQDVSDWYLGMFADGVDWATVPNVVGMSQHADAGVVATKPYVSSGRYIDRMSDYCRGCAFSPTESEGDRACPFTALYWNFLLTHETAFRRNARMRIMMGQVRSMSRERRAEVRISAKRALVALGLGKGGGGGHTP